MDADDAMDKTRLEKIRDAMYTHNADALLHTHSQHSDPFLNANDVRTRRRNLLKKIQGTWKAKSNHRFGSDIPGAIGHISIRKKVFNKEKQTEVEGAEDSEYVARIIDRGYDLIFIPDVLSTYNRQNSSNWSSSLLPAASNQEDFTPRIHNISQLRQMRWGQVPYPLLGKVPSHELEVKHPECFKYFRYVIQNNKIIAQNPKGLTTRVHENSMDWFLKQKLNRSPNILVEGSDWPLSHYPQLVKPNPVIDQYKTIYIEGKDIPHKKVKTFPMLFSYAYLLMQGSDNIMSAYREASNNKKSKLVSTAFGTLWKELDEKPERQKLIKWIDKTPWISRDEYEPKDFLKEVAKNKFFVCALGNGIQSTRMFECYLVRTIPIVERKLAFEELQKYGFPMLIVDSWEELSPPYLNNIYTKEFQNVDWPRIQYALTNEGVNEFFLQETGIPNILRL